MRKIVITVIAIIVTIGIVLAALFVVGGYTWIEQLLGLKERPVKRYEKKETAKERAAREETEFKLAQEIISQQRESKENLSRLADGQIKKITVDRVSTIPNEASVAIEAFYTNESSLAGAMSFWRRDGIWYLIEVTRQPRLPNPPRGTLIGGLTEEDVAIGKQIATEQRKHQEVITDLITGQVRYLRVDRVDGRTETATVYVTTGYADGKKLKVAIDMSFVNGYWYIVSMYERQ